ncbi:hypothetical protein Leryth_016126 [Lithospermum erythrorhizon]|nr:hypothetical protein Leryth_016126 [Lithospermum erythrorhizon]
MLSSENPPPDPCEISQLNSISTDDKQPSGVLQSDLLILCPKFTIRDYAFSNRKKDIKTNWPFSEKSLQLCLNHGVKNLLPPFQSLDAKENSVAHLCTTETSLVRKENEYHQIDQASRLTDNILSFTSDDAQPSITSVDASLNKSEGVRLFSSMVVEAETPLNYSASKPVKKLALVANKAENIMKPLIKKCRQIVKLNNFAADRNKLENNTSNNFLVSETMASKVCPVCKTFTSSSNTTLNAHIDQCLSGESVSQWTSDPKVTKSRVKPRRMRSMVEIYETAQHCTIEELERRNGINLASSLSLPAQDMEAGSVERKRKSPVDFEETENEGDGTGKPRHVDGDKSSKISLAKKKKKTLQEKHHKLQIRLSNRKELCSPSDHQNSQIIGIQECTSGPEDLEVEEAFAKSQSAPVLVKYREPGPVGRIPFSKRSVLTKMNDKGDHLHPTWTKKKKLTGGHLHPTRTKKKKLTGVNNVVSHRYSFVNGGCGSKSNKPSGTPPASPRSSEHHDDYGRVNSLRRSVRVPLGSELFCDGNNPLGERNQKELLENNSSVKYKNKDNLRNKSSPMASLSIQKVKVKRALTRNASSVVDNSKHILHGHDLSSNSRGFLSVTKKQASRLSKSQASASESTFGPKSKRVDFKRPHAYCESESDGEDVVRQTDTNDYDDSVTLDRRGFKVGRDGGKIKISGKGEILVIKGMKSTSNHCKPQRHGTNDSYSDNITANSEDENESAQNNVQPYEKDVVDEATCSNPLFESSKGLYKSSDFQHHEVAGHLDVQSDSSGYVKFYDGPSVGTEYARYPIDSFFDGGEEMFYIDANGKSILGQNVHATTELHSNDGSGSYYAEVDLIPIPGPPGSFLPSPSPDEFHGKSTPTSSHDQSYENLHEFVDKDSSDSPSPTSTISNSDIAKFESSLNEKLPFRCSIQDMMISGASDATGGTSVDKISLEPSAASVAGEGLDSVEPKSHLLYSAMQAPLRLKNDQQCRCSQKDGVVLSPAVLNYQDGSPLSWSTMSSVPESLVNTQVNPDKTRRANNCSLTLNVPSSGHMAGEIHNCIGDPPRLIANNASSNSGIKFFNTDGESASPSTPNPVFRLMGKDLMVVNKDETSFSHQTAKQIIVSDDASESSVDLAPGPAYGMGLMNRRRPSIESVALMASGVNPANSNSMYGYQPETSHSGSSPLALAANFQVPYMMGVSHCL